MNITSLLKNPRKRFEAIIRPHLRALYRRAYRLTFCEHDAEELVQELLLKLYEKQSELGGIDKIENIQGWMMRILYHLYIDRWRRENHNPVLQPENITSENLYIIETSEKGPLEKISQLQTRQQIHHALQSLKAEQQLLIVMHDMEGHSLPELSKKLDIPLGTLKSRLHRARKQMKEILHCVEPFEQQIRLQVEA